MTSLTEIARRLTDLTDRWRWLSEEMVMGSDHHHRLWIGWHAVCEHTDDSDYRRFPPCILRYPRGNVADNSSMLSTAISPSQARS